MDTKTPYLPRDAKGKRPSFYETEGTDQLVSMVMVLASELSVLRDRIDAHERVAVKHGINFAEEINSLTLDEAALQERESERQNFLDRLFYVSRKETQDAAAGATRDAFHQTIDDIAQQ